MPRCARYCARCPHCQSFFHVARSMYGRDANCPCCKVPFTVRYTERRVWAAEADTKHLIRGRDF